MKHLCELKEKYPEIHFIFDTKMAAFHQQLDLLYEEKYDWLWKEGHIRHYHVNDYAGGYGKAWGVLEMKFDIQNIESKQLNGWLRSAEFAVGGFMWVGFSKRQPNRLLCISSQYISLVDCDTGEFVECDADYDEESFVAISESFSDEVVEIYGQYGGNPILQTVFGEEILICRQKEEFAEKTVIRTKVTFQTLDENIILYNNYGFYTCSFSPCGNYMVFADDGGVTVFKRVIN